MAFWSMGWTEGSPGATLQNAGLPWGGPLPGEGEQTAVPIRLHFSGMSLTSEFLSGALVGDGGRPALIFMG